MKYASSLLPALLVAAPLAAQADISIADGSNVTCQINFNTTSVVYAATADFFKADPAGDPAGVLFTTAWAYRLGGDTQEFILNKGGANNPSFNSSGNTGTAIWNDVDGRGQISATLVYTAVSTGTNSGAVTARCTITNISQAPITLNLFHLSDFDLCGTAYATNTVTPGGDGRQTYSGSCTETCEHFASAPDRWEVGSYTNVPTGSGNIDLYTQLEDTAVTNLRNDTAPFGPYDIRGAFQWQDKEILPSASMTFTIAFGHNERVCAYGENYYGSGIAGANGVPQITLTGPAMLSGNMSLAVVSGPSSASGNMFVGFARNTINLGDLNLYAGPPNVSLPFPTNSTGGGGVTLPVPNDPALCGELLVGQALFVDGTSVSTSGLPLTHTGAVAFTVGTY